MSIRPTSSDLGQRLVQAAYDAEMQADDMMLSEFADNAKQATIAVLETLADQLDIEDSDEIDVSQLRIIVDWVRSAEAKP